MSVTLHPAATAAQARAILTNPQLCDERPTLAELAWLAICTAAGRPAIQSRMGRVS